jgi:hypothetical protein
MSQQDTIKRHAVLLRAWHLAILRFALTRNNADRLGVLAIANEIDRLGRRPHEIRPGFNFFRRESEELCAATLRQHKESDVVLNRYLAQINDVRLKRTLEVAFEVPRKPGLASNRHKPNYDLWRGLPSRGSPQH